MIFLGGTLYPFAELKDLYFYKNTLVVLLLTKLNSKQ